MAKKQTSESERLRFPDRVPDLKPGTYKDGKPLHRGGIKCADFYVTNLVEFLDRLEGGFGCNGAERNDSVYCGIIRQIIVHSPLTLLEIDRNRQNLRMMERALESILKASDSFGPTLNCRFLD